MTYQRKEIIVTHNVEFIGEEPKVLIYCFKAAAALPPVYIGSTSQALRLRVRAHLLDARKGSDLPIHAWLRNRQEFAVEVLEIVDASTRTAREKHWIASFDGLLNMTDGGPGMSGHHFAGTAHARRIGEKIRTAKKYACEVCGELFHRKHSQAIKGNCRFCSRACYYRWQSKRGAAERVAA